MEHRLNMQAQDEKLQEKLRNKSPLAMYLVVIISIILITSFAVMTICCWFESYMGQHVSHYNEFLEMPYDTEPVSVYTVNDIIRVIDFDNRIDRISFFDEIGEIQTLYYTEVEVTGIKENTYIEVYTKTDPEEIYPDMTLVKIYINENEANLYDNIWLQLDAEKVK